MSKDILRVAKILLRNTTNIYLIEYLKIFIHELKDEERIFDVPLYLALKKICQERFKITDFALTEIVASTTFLFGNCKRKSQSFMLKIIEGRAIAINAKHKLACLSINEAVGPH